jgi:hypothetical protein
MPELNPALRDLHVVLRTLAILVSIVVVVYLYLQTRIPEDQRPSPAVRAWITGSAVTMFVIAIGLAVASFTVSF